MYFTVYTHQHSRTRNIFSSLCIKPRVKILNASAKYWGGGANTLWPPNQIIGGAMAPLPLPPYRAPMWCSISDVLFTGAPTLPSKPQTQGACCTNYGGRRRLPPDVGRTNYRPTAPT